MGAVKKTLENLEFDNQIPKIFCLINKAQNDEKPNNTYKLRDRRIGYSGIKQQKSL